ncbi:Thiosulfate sulfurtransferase PspE precursor [Moraxella lacunata]|uniref:Thiosulfate sulfurtransferase PspE n=1 Tax=Moraxella lacunata TaxID=477 RepID=A0A378QH36_MORLA|nr:rhodanese-like domain-containing protein [Moraxella lacunata]STZ00206.1 Thiosulfate sulfurtransferase PspE precursor [Moraxella lacunata]
MIKTQDIAEFAPNDNLTIWDVRDADSYRSGHIAHAINVPIEHINAETLAQSVGDVYVLCGGGTKAGRACELLESLDPSRTYIHLTGGTRGAKALGWTLIED